MPRCARIKSFDSVYHVMVRSVGDIPLFKDDCDKDYYLGKVKKYMEIFMFKIYAYCLMDTHAHFIIDSNGADISKFMHVINQCYAQYYNRVNDRHGHVFGDRFKSKIVDDEAYLITLSGYIHNNPSDIKEYKDNVEEYAYSSLGIFLGLKNDRFKILDEAFVMQHFSSDVAKAREMYKEYMKLCVDPDMREVVEFEDEKGEYRSERRILVRDYTPEMIAEYVSKYTGNNPDDLHIREKRRAREFRGLCILLMRSLCDYTYREICAVTGNITISQASRLANMGLDSIHNNDRYSGIIQDLLGEFRRHNTIA